MPIKGLTDKDSLTPRFPRIGKLRKGGEKGAKGFGPDLDHFRFTSERPEAVAAFVAAYGQQPRQINCYLPYASADANFPTWKEEWKAGGLQHRCDGQTCTIWLMPDGKKYSREPKPCPGGCDEVGRLELIIPELLEAGIVGTVSLETHSLNDMMSIMASLTHVEQMRGDNPLGLRGIMFTLRRVPEKISTPGWGDNKGKRQLVEKWLVKIEPAVDWVTAQMALQRAGSMPALTTDENTVDAEAVEITGDAGEPVASTGSQKLAQAVEEQPESTQSVPEPQQSNDVSVTCLTVAKTRSNKPYLKFFHDGEAYPWWGGRAKLHREAPWIALTDEQLAVDGASYELPVGTVAVLETNPEGYTNVVGFKRVIISNADGLEKYAADLKAQAATMGIELPDLPTDPTDLSSWVGVAESAVNMSPKQPEMDF